MTQEIRKKKVFFLSECILNQNIRAYGVGNMDGRGAIDELINLIVASGFGISVVPCPEIPYEGLKRKACNKEPYENPHYRDNCATLAKQLVDRYKMYLDDDYRIGGFICVNGSPSCAIDYCYRGINVCEKCDEPGIFIEEVQKELKRNNLELAFIGMQLKALPIVLESVKKIINSMGDHL